MKSVSRSRTVLKMLVLVGCVVCLGGAAWVYATTGLYGFNLILRRGMTTWAPVAKDDARLTDAMRLALKEPVPPAVAGAIKWQSLLTGLEVSEMPVLVETAEVDRIMLTRIDPARFRLRVMTAPAGNKDVDDWMRTTGAAFVINGSYYAQDGTPATPLISDGQAFGPKNYDARHGAFTATDTKAGIVDLKTASWKTEIGNATQAMVSFPLLIDAEGQSRAQKSDPRWLAARSFVGQDQRGLIIAGTTVGAFFSLDRFADFLRNTPLDLKLALNLDGGPPACQAVSVADYKRSFCGSLETQTQGDQIILLGNLIGSRRWALPIVLAAFPR